MENLYFDDFEEFACDVSDKYDLVKNSEYDDVAVVSKYEEARQIIKELICLGYDLHSIDIDDEVDGYNAEYIITLYDNEIWCDKMLMEHGYISDDSPIMYILDNCSSKVIPYCKGAIIFEVSVGDDECEDTEESYSINGIPATKEEFDAYVEKIKKNDSKSKCDKCVEYSKDDDGDIHGFTASKSDGDGYVCYSFYTSENLMKNDIEDILKLF